MKIIILNLFITVFISVSATATNVEWIVLAGKLHYLIEYNYPIKNYQNYKWDALLVDVIKGIEKNKINSNCELSEYLQKKYSFLSDHIHIDVKEPEVNNEKIDDYYAYKHLGVGFENNKRFQKQLTYFSTPILVSSIDNNFYIKPHCNYKIADSLYVSIKLPQTIRKYRYNGNTNLNRNKAYHYQNKFIRMATLLKAYYVYDAFYPYSKNNLVDYLKQSLQETNDDKSVGDFIYTIEKLLSHFNDGHCTYHYIYSKWLIAFAKYKYYPKFNTQIINSKIVITNVDTSLQNKIRTNDVVVQINDKSCESMLNEKSQYVSAATGNYRLLKAKNRLFESFKKDSIINLTLLRGEKQIKTSIIANNAFSYKNRGNKYKPIIRVNDTVMYIDLTNTDLSIKCLLEKDDAFKNAKTVLFNLNGYPNYLADQVLSYFIRDTVRTSDFKTPVTYSNSNQRSWDLDSWVISPKGKYDANCVFLTNNTVSYGETLLEMIKYYNLGLIVGGRSAGTNGDIARIDLPIGFFFLTGLKVERNGVVNIPVEPDINFDFGNSNNLSDKNYLNLLVEKIIVK
jgi:C-terminal processing protease CtpA/Prc